MKIVLIDKTTINVVQKHEEIWINELNSTRQFFEIKDSLGKKTLINKNNILFVEFA